MPAWQGPLNPFVIDPSAVFMPLIQGPQAFFAGMGEARRNAQTQHNIAAANLQNQQAQQWGQLGSQVGSSLGMLGTGAVLNATLPQGDTPFMGTTGQGFRQGLGAALLAGNLNPTAQRYVALQQHADVQSQLQQQHFQLQQGLEDHRFNRYYEDAHGFTPQQGEQIGQQLFGPETGELTSPQSAMLAGAGYTPQAWASAPPGVKTQFYRGLATDAAMYHRSQMQSGINQAMQDQASQLQLTDAVRSGDVAITQPTWQKKWNDLETGISQVAGDASIGEPQRAAMLMQARREQGNLVRQMQGANVLQRKVDPQQALMTEWAGSVKAAKALGMKSVLIRGSDGKTREVSLADDKLDTTGWTQQQFQDHVNNAVVDTPSGSFIVQPGGKIEPAHKGAGGSSAIDPMKIMSEIIKVEGGKPPEQKQLTADEIAEKATKLTIALTRAQADAAAVQRSVENFSNSSAGKAMDFLDQMDSEQLSRVGVGPAYKNLPPAQKRAVADWAVRTSRDLATRVQAAQQQQSKIQAGSNTAQTLRTQAIGNAMNQPQQGAQPSWAPSPKAPPPGPVNTPPGQGVPIPQGPPLQQRQTVRPLNMAKKDRMVGMIDTDAGGNTIIWDGARWKKEAVDPMAKYRRPKR